MRFQKNTDLCGRGLKRPAYTPLTHLPKCTLSFQAIFFLFIGRKPTTWPANNCLQIINCSCAKSSNCVRPCVGPNGPQIIFCSCVNETRLFSFLRSFLRGKRQIASLPEDIHYKQTCWSNDKTVFKLGYRKISWFVSVPQINNIACLSLRLWQIIDLLSLTTDKSRYFAQPRPIIVNYLLPPPHRQKKKFA